MLASWPLAHATEGSNGGIPSRRGALLRLSRWAVNRGIFLDPRVLQDPMCLVGALLIFCDEVGASFMVDHFGIVEAGMVRIARASKLMSLELLVRVNSQLEMPAALTMEANRKLFLMRVHLWPVV